MNTRKKKLTAKEAMKYLVDNMEPEELRTFIEAMSLMIDPLGRKIMARAAEE